MNIFYKIPLLLLIVCQHAHPFSQWKQIKESPFPINTNQAFRNGPRQLMYSPDGTFLAVANHGGFPDQNGSISIFSVNQNTSALKEVNNSPFLTGEHQTIGLAFSPAGKASLVATSLDRFGAGSGITIFDFDPITGKLSNVRTPSICTDAQTSATYSPDGLFAAAGGFSTSLFVVDQGGSDAGNLNCFLTTPTINIPVRSVAYRPLQASEEVYYLASLMPFSPLVQIFTLDKNTGAPINSPVFTLPAESNPRWITFSPNGNFVAISAFGGVEVRQFIADGSGEPQLLPLEGSVSFFPVPDNSSSNSIGSGGSETLFSGSVHPNPFPIPTPQDPVPALVRSVAYSPNGKWLATANGNNIISIFTVNRNTGVLFNRQDFEVGHIGNFGASDKTVSIDFSPDSCSLAVTNRDDNSISVFKIISSGCIACQLNTENR